MRRAAMALVVLGLLGTAAAGCSLSANHTAQPGSVGGGGAGQATSMNPTVEASLADTRNLCDAVGKVYTKDYATFARALSKLATSRKSSADSQKTSMQQAQTALKAFADDLRGATQTSTNTQARADGAQVADQLQTHAGDGAVFEKVKTPNDVQTLLGPTMKGWLAPIANHGT